MGMGNNHLVVIGDPRHMAEVPDESVQLVATSPPLFDLEASFEGFDKYLKEMQLVFRECYRVLEKGRCICVNVCDVMSRQFKYPIPAHYALLLQRAGFEYRDDIIWRKPRTTYPMYYFPNNVLGHIIIMRKGKFDCKQLFDEDKHQASVSMEEARHRWSTDLWNMHWEAKNKENDASTPFPEELPEALIRLYTYEGETVLDPFLLSGTTTKAAASMGRKSIAYAPDRSRLPLLGIIPDGLEIIEQGRCFE